MAKDTTAQPKKMPKHTPAVFDVLKQCAADMTTISYGDLAEQVGTHHRVVLRPLGYIRDELCRPHGRPWLNMIAVNGKTKRPSEGATASTGVEIDGERWWRGMVLQVYAYDWSEVDLEHK